MLYMLYIMEEQILVVRGVGKKMRIKLRQKAVERGLSMGDALTEAIENWVDATDAGRPDPENLQKMVGIIKVGKKVKWSSEVDETLYGWRK